MKDGKFTSIARVLAIALIGLVFTGCETLNNSGSGLGSTNAPAVTGAEPLKTSDIIGVGEKLTIEIRDTGGVEDRAFNQTVGEDGKITLLYNKSVMAAGRKKAELEEAIHDLYVPTLFKRMTVVVKRDELSFFVTGEVKMEGQKPYVGRITGLRAIGAAGGFTDFAKRTNVQITRANGNKVKFNANKALKDPSMDPPVYPGDTVHVDRRFW
jgi:polysaccharide biosynthesis/export protein VpsN